MVHAYPPVRGVNHNMQLSVLPVGTKYNVFLDILFFVLYIEKAFIWLIYIYINKYINIHTYICVCEKETTMKFMRESVKDTHFEILPPFLVIRFLNPFFQGVHNFFLSVFSIVNCRKCSVCRNYFFPLFLSWWHENVVSCNRNDI